MPGDRHTGAVTPFLSAHDEGVVVEVWVTPGAVRSVVGGIHDGALRVRVSVPPEKGRANRAVVDLLVRDLGGHGGEVLSGAASRRKRVLVRGVSVATASGILTGD